MSIEHAIRLPRGLVWPDWYARYMTAEESGEALPS